MCLCKARHLGIETQQQVTALCLCAVLFSCLNPKSLGVRGAVSISKEPIAVTFSFGTRADLAASREDNVLSLDFMVSIWNYITSGK